MPGCIDGSLSTFVTNTQHTPECCGLDICEVIDTFPPRPDYGKREGFPTATHLKNHAIDVRHVLLSATCHSH